MTRKVAYFTVGVLLMAAMAFPQAGRLEGVVQDAQGLVLPGISGHVQPFAKLTGFQTLNREGVIVTTGSTFTINVSLQLATVSETITATGGSPIVDVKTPGVSATFDTQQLEETPACKRGRDLGHDITDTGH